MKNGGSSSIRPYVIVGAGLILAGMVNLLAYRHARAMLNFSQAGERTQPPELLTFWQKLKILIFGVSIPKPQNRLTPGNFGLSFIVHWIKVNHVVELEAWYIPQPQPKGVVLMFHGYASAKESLLPEANALYEFGYSVFMVDFRGSGGSNGYKTSLGFFEAEDVVAASAYIRQLAPGCPLILFGRSMGGAAILRAFYVFRIQPEAIIIEAIFDKMMATVQNRFTAMGLPAFPAAALLILWGSIHMGYSGFKHNPAHYATAVHVPTLMLHGANDPRATIAQGAKVFRQLSGPKRFVTFAEVGHDSYFAVQPRQWQQAISSFLTQPNGRSN